MIAHKTTRLWTLSNDQREFERMRTLFDGSLKSVLDDQKIGATLREMTIAELGQEAVVIALHDPCDIRKAHSEKLASLGVVRDLSGKLVNGYNTFNTVCVNGAGKQLQLSDIRVFSNGDKLNYVKQMELDALVRKQVKAVKKQEDAELTEREQTILQLLKQDEVVNIGEVTRAQLSAISQQFKAVNPEVELWHVLDRQFDGMPLFEFIAGELKDKFIIRLKISRNSNETELNEKGKSVAIKLKLAPLQGKQVDVIDKVRFKKQVYQQAKRIMEWGTLCLEGETYSVVRVTFLKRDGGKIFKQPMLLITNQSVTTYAQALASYRTYLMRSKIEDVFKFVKNALGWEQFQIRDWESIKNMIAFAFFIGGYFYKIEPQLTDHPIIKWLCQLGKGKGKVTRRYLLEGLKNLLIYQYVEKIRTEMGTDSLEWETILEFIT